MWLAMRHDCTNEPQISTCSTAMELKHKNKSNIYKSGNEKIETPLRHNVQ